MTGDIHPMAAEHLPYFITAPGDVDRMFWVVGVMLLAIVIGIGTLYFRLHALPEHMAHGRGSTQFQLVGVLALLALFTHNSLFWIAALVIAALHVPNITGALLDIADAVRGHRRASDQWLQTGGSEAEAERNREVEPEEVVIAAPSGAPPAAGTSAAAPPQTQAGPAAPGIGPADPAKGR